MLHRGGSKAEHRLDPEHDLAQGGSGALSELKRQPWSKHLEILTRPMGGHRVRVMEVEGFHRTIPQRCERPLPVLTRHFAGSHQGLQGKSEQPADQEIQHTEPATCRKRTTQAAESIGGDTPGIDEAAAGGMEGNELVVISKVVLDPGKEVGLSVPGTGGLEEDATACMIGADRQYLPELFISSAIDRLRMHGGQAAEGFKQRLERMLGGHGK